MGWCGSITIVLSPRCAIIKLMNLKLSKQSKIILLSLLSLALLGGVSYGGWRCWQSKQVATEPQKPYIIGEQPSPPSIPITKPTDDPNWNLYINEKYGFSVEYPAGWKVKEEIISRSREPEYVARDIIDFRLEGSGYLALYVFEDSHMTLENWVEFNKVLLELSSLAQTPIKPNSRIAGNAAFTVFSPTDQYAPASVVSAFKGGSYILRTLHGRVGSAVGEPLLWDIYEHFLRTFEFEGTENIPDELPKFPMGF